MIPDAHCHKTPLDGMTVAGVAVADERRLVPREGFGDLPRDPLRRRMVGNGTGLSTLCRRERRRYFAESLHRRLPGEFFRQHFDGQVKRA